MITRLQRNEGYRDSSFGGNKQNLMCTKTQRKGAVTPQETETKLPASVGGFPVVVCVGRGSPQGWGSGRIRPRMAPFVQTLLEVANN